MNKWLSTCIVLGLATATGCLQLDDVNCVSGDDCDPGLICVAGACVADDRPDTGVDGDADTAPDGVDPDAVEDATDTGGDSSDAIDGDAPDSDSDSADATDAADSGDAADTDTDGSGTCDAVNACGGCAELDEEIGASCGRCELDQYICDGEDAVVCSGDTACDEVALITLEAFDVTTSTFSIRAAVSITDELALLEHGVCIDNEPAPSLEFDDCVLLGSLDATATFSAAFDGLDAASLYFARAFVETETGVQYGNELEVGTAPEAPLEMSATAGDLAESVFVTWAPVDGAQQYILYRDNVELITLTETGFDDTTAGAGSPPAITAASVNATKGELVGAVELTWSEAIPLSGQQHNYVVTAVFEGQESAPSDTAIGFRAGPAAARYEVSIDGGDFASVGALTSFRDETAPSGILAGGTALATDGTSRTLVSLTVVDFGHTPQIVEYAVRPVTFDDTPGEAVTIEGYAGVGEILIEWQRRAQGTSSFETLAGVVGAVASDAPPSASPYEYRARISAPPLNAISTADEGFVDDSLPDVTTLPVENITATTATYRLSLSTTLGDIGFCWSSTTTSPAQGDPESTCTDTSPTQTSLDVTGLTPGTRYFVRAYSEPLGGGAPGYGAAVTFVTIPAAPTGLVASDAEFVDFVNVQWDAAAGATSYQVFRNGTPIGTTNRTSYTDTSAAPSATPTMTGVPFTASNNTLPDFVQLTWGAPTVLPGPVATYSVIAINESGASPQSATDLGSRGASPITAYEVELPGTGSGTTLWRDVGPELTWNDDTAPAGQVVPAEITASDEVYEQWVRLSTEAAARQAGESRSYRVRAVIGTVPGTPSTRVVGARGTGAPSYQWQRRSTAGVWEDITGATGLNAIDRNGAITPERSEYRVVVSAQGVTSVASDSDSGSRAEQLRIEELQAGDAFSCARYQDGSVRCWGQNTDGQAAVPGQSAVGDSFSDLPLTAINLDGSATALALGAAHACAIVDEAVFCWGAGGDGRLGTGSTASVGLGTADMPPTAVPLPEPAVAIGAGDDFSCALLDDGRVYCWGSNERGQLGTIATESIGDDGDDRLDPVSVAGGPLGTLRIPITVASIHIGPATSCAIDDSGEVICWGNLSAGIICSGPASTGVGPRVVSWTAEDIAIGDNALCALTSSGQVGCCGSSTVGQGGTGTTTSWGAALGQVSPRPLTLSSRALGITAGRFHFCAQQNSGLTCWGRAASGALGNGSSSNNLGDQMADLPLPLVGGFTSVRLVAAGAQHTCVVSGDKSLFCFGEGTFGRLGNASSADVGDAPGEMPPWESVIR